MSEDVPAVICNNQYMVFHKEESWKAYRASKGNPQAWSDGKRSWFIDGAWCVYLEVH